MFRDSHASDGGFGANALLNVTHCLHRETRSLRYKIDPHHVCQRVAPGRSHAEILHQGPRPRRLGGAGRPGRPRPEAGALHGLAPRRARAGHLQPADRRTRGPRLERIAASPCAPSPHKITSLASVMAAKYATAITWVVAEPYMVPCALPHHSEAYERVQGDLPHRRLRRRETL